jgi:hypothetical protein
MSDAAPVSLVAGNLLPVAFQQLVVPAATSAATSVAAGDGLWQAVANATAQFSITAKDRSGNMVPSGGGLFSFALLTPSGQRLDYTAVDFNNGSYLGSWSSDLAGSCALELTYLGAPVSLGVALQRVAVFPGPSSAATSQATYSVSSLVCEATGLRTGANLGGCQQCGLTDSSAGTQAYFLIQARDQWGNNRIDVAPGQPLPALASAAYDGPQDVFAVTITPLNVVPSAKDNLAPKPVYGGNGLFLVRYNLTTSTEGLLPLAY